MADVVTLDEHRPKVVAEVVDAFRILLERAKAGQVAGFACLALDAGGAFETSYFLPERTQMAQASVMLLAELMKILAETE